MDRLTNRLYELANQVPTGSSVLDVGCSDGRLLAHLRDERRVDGRGIEIDPGLVAKAVARGLSVVQGDAKHDLAAFPSSSVDYAILSETLQAMESPALVLAELVRIGRRAIVAFPNFGHWRVRAALMFSGKMPMTKRLSQSWYETANIHLCTVLDFEELARDMGLVIERKFFLSNRRHIRFWPNFRADHALFVLRK